MYNNESPENIAVFAHLIDGLPRKIKDRTKEDIIQRLKDEYEGRIISSQFITIYSNKHPSEAFAETFAIWMQHHLGRLPDKVRYLFKNIMESYGIRINESIKSPFAKFLNEINFETSKDRDYPADTNSVIVFNKKDNYKIKGKTHNITSHAIKHLHEFDKSFYDNIIDQAKQYVSNTNFFILT
ncbi:MAG: hypothetical protein ACOCT9_01990, partial [archaeon]